MEEKIINKLQELDISVDSRYFNTHNAEIDHQNIPIFYFEKKSASRNVILITAGADGDELDGIAAALSLPEKISNLKLPFSVVILPILNPMAFLSESSFAQDDGKFLKHIYPGNPTGSSSEKLMDKIYTKFFGNVMAWIDLHGGNKHESLTPFFYGFETMSEELDRKTMDLFSSRKKDLCVFQKNHNWKKIDRLADDNIWYLISESGGEYKLNANNQKIHKDRVLDLILYSNKRKTRLPNSFKKSDIEFINLSSGVAWVKSDCLLADESVSKSDLLGLKKKWIFSKKVKSSCSGKILWIRNSSKLDTSDTVCAILKD